MESVGRAIEEEHISATSVIKLFKGAFLHRSVRSFAALASMIVLVLSARAQVNVYTAHNDSTRGGLNAQEKILTPANVNATQFGQLFNHTVVGAVYAQPLYVANVAIPNSGTHNVVYVATSGDWVYAFDADTNGGANAKPLWADQLTNTPSGAGLANYNGISSTPVIDPGTKTIYLVSSEFNNGKAISRFHALDITTGAEKFGGPMNITASTPGTGVGSTGGVLAFDPQSHLQRAALLLQNGIVYVAFGSISDQGAWHGWLFSYGVNQSTQKLQQIDFLCTTPNGQGAGFWQSGAGIAGEVYSAAKPYGRIFITSANGTFPATDPMTMAVLDFDVTNGKFTLEDEFIPYNAVTLSANDADLGSGGPILLPTQTLASGKKLNPLLEIGKSGMYYILDRDNNNDGSNNPNTEYAPAGLGGYNLTADHVVQEVQSTIYPGSQQGWGEGVWGTEAYWNNNIYIAGNLPSGHTSLTAYSFINGQLSTAPTSQAPATDAFTYPTPTPSVSANGNTNGIVWITKNDPYPTIEPEILLAYDATNLANRLYSSNTNLGRDNPGYANAHAVPTIANGKVYVGAQGPPSTGLGQISVFGLLNSEPRADSPVISPGSTANAAFPLTVTINAAAGATIYYTTNGTTPTSSSSVYTGPFSVKTNATIKAIASLPDMLQSSPAIATYASPNTPTNPAFSLAPGAYSGTQTTSLSTSSSAATIYYTLDGTTPSPNTGTTKAYTGPITITVTETINAIAIAPNNLVSGISTATYTINPLYSINFPNGFSAANGPIAFNGSTNLDDFRLQLTNGGKNESGSAIFATPVNVQAFTTQFTFQLSNPGGDGITFMIENSGPHALGGVGGGLGYAGIKNSVAIKFDIYNNAGEGVDSTGLYVNGASPTKPAIDMTSSGINLHSGDFMFATVTYNGTNLQLTLVDEVTQATFTTSWTIDIPTTVGGNTAYVGFTGGTGGATSSQKLTTWNYLVGAPVPNYPNGFNATGLVLNGTSTGKASINGTRLRLTDGGQLESHSAFYQTAVNIQQFSTNFNFQFTNASGDGFTFTIQGDGPSTVEPNSVGGDLGYAGINRSLAIKFDIFSNAGEGCDSTGAYVNGAIPETPAVDLSGTQIQMNPGCNGIGNGDIFNVKMNYNGANLVVTITDTVTKATATQTYNVNIPGIVAGPTAWVGFTAGTGGATAVQDILSWTFTPISIPQPSFSGGFAGQGSQLTLNGGASINGSNLLLTDGNSNETRSAFFTAPVNIQQFTTGFEFQLTNASGDGFTFTIQNNSPKALGTGGGGLGYGGIGRSAAVKFDLYNNSGEGRDSTGLYTNGSGPATPAINLLPTGINFHNGDVFNVQMVYNGTTLTVVYTDVTLNVSTTENYVVNLPALVGGNTAYVGFTAASGGATAVQNILNWTYTSGAPITPFFKGFAAGVSQISLNGGVVLNGQSLELTDGGANEARSAFFSNPVNVQQFVNNFTFQLVNPAADGFTFAIQGVNPTAVGGYGGGLGFNGLPNSVSVKFDLFSNVGEGPDSTGLYTNGAIPELPAVNLTGTGINLHATTNGIGDIFGVTMVYNGTTLTVTITDMNTGAVAVHNYAVNIPSYVGGETAYVGFTAGTGGATSTQNILDWHYYSAGNI